MSASGVRDRQTDGQTDGHRHIHTGEVAGLCSDAINAYNVIIAVDPHRSIKLAPPTYGPRLEKNRRFSRKFGFLGFLKVLTVLRVSKILFLDSTSGDLEWVVNTDWVRVWTVDCMSTSADGPCCRD